MTTVRSAEQVRADWESRIGAGRARTTEDLPVPVAPTDLRAFGGRGHVRLDWSAVAGAVGYLVHRADSADGPFHPVDHQGGDVLAIPHPPYVDAGAEPGRKYWYAVAALADVSVCGPLSEPVVVETAEATEATDHDSPTVSMAVDVHAVTGELARPWRAMIGSEHLSHQLSAERVGGRPIGTELTKALRIAHTELGVKSVRAHGILCDDLSVYREIDGQPTYDFSGIDKVYDLLAEIGMRPVVELSFMPADLASDPTATVFTYGAIISPPKDWDRWADLIRALVRHLLDRYGTEEVVRNWSFEVWNEPNLEVFWSGTKDEFLRLYDVTARAVRDVDDRLLVAGPATAAAGWVEDSLSYLDSAGVPMDAVTTHTYGSPPLDLRPALERHRRTDTRVWWTEWGVTPTHFHPVCDSVFAACFLASGMKSAAGRVEALTYWVCSDHFEELGRPPELLHGGFGLLTVGNLRKPSFYALSMLERLGSHELAVEASGDGADGLVQAWASVDPRTGRVAVAAWNSPLDQAKFAGDPALDRKLALTITGLDAPTYEFRHYRVDATHSNVVDRWSRMSGRGWPTESEWTSLWEQDSLELGEPVRTITATAGAVKVDCAMPQPSMILLEVIPL